MKHPVSEKMVSDISVLVGEKLSAAIFVMDYLQLDFDGILFTCWNWPLVENSAAVFSVSSSGYRDAVCDQIAKRVSRIEITEEVCLIAFEDTSRITIPLEVTADGPPEAAMFSDDGRKVMIVWN